MIVPTINKTSELLTAEEREQRYGARSLAELRKDMNLLWTWKGTVGTEKDRMDSDILSLKRRYNGALAMSILAIVGCVGIMAWALWG
jgi:hypothetical protein